MKTMKSTMARLFALCLTVAMVLSMATMGAFATNVTIGQKGNITINSAASDNGAEVDLYKIMNVNLVNANGTVQPKDPMYSWVDKVANWLNANATYKAYINADNNNAVTDSFKNATAAQLSKFFHDMKAAIEPGEDEKVELELTAAKSITISGTAEKITEMEMGQYLVIAEKSAYVYSPATVTLAPVWDGEHEEWVLNDAAVTVKGRGGIDKNVEGENGDNSDLGYAVGDTVTYRLDVVIPDYPEKATATEFNVGDKMGIGLTWDKAVTVYWSTDGTIKTTTEGEGEDQKEVYDSEYIVDDSYYTLATPGPDGATFEVQFNYDELTTDRPTAKYVHVVYNATLNEDAFEEDALGNDAYLGVNTDPYDEGSYDTTETHEDVYTYGINVDKVDIEKPDTSLKGAEFTLKGTDGEAIEFAKVSDGVYVKYDADNYTKEENVTPVTTVVVAADGTLQLRGVDVGTYTLTETKAPGGYQLPADPTTTIVMKDEQKGTERGQDGNLDNSSVKGSMVIGSTQVSKNIIGFKLGNAKPGFELPTTGGMGTVLFTAGGLVIMACGAALVLVTLKKKKAED